MPPGVADQALRGLKDLAVLVKRQTESGRLAPAGLSAGEEPCANRGELEGFRGPCLLGRRFRPVQQSAEDLIKPRHATYQGAQNTTGAWATGLSLANSHTAAFSASQGPGLGRHNSEILRWIEVPEPHESSVNQYGGHPRTMGIPLSNLVIVNALSSSKVRAAESCRDGCLI